MIKEIAPSMVESIAFLSYRFNGIAPHFHPEAFDITREGERFLLSRRYDSESAEVSSREVAHFLRSLCRADAIDPHAPAEREPYVCTFPGNFWGVRVKVVLRDGNLIAADDFSRPRLLILPRWRWRYRVRMPSSDFLAHNDDLRSTLRVLFPDATVVERLRLPREQQQSEAERERLPAREGESRLVRSVAIRATETDEPLFDLCTVPEPTKRLAETLAAGANINAVDQNGRTPLAHAIHSGRHRLIAPLLEAGADPNIQDDNGQTVLRRVSRSVTSEAGLALIRQLIDAGADSRILGKDGRTARDDASDKERAERVAYDARVEFQYPRHQPALYSRDAIDRAVELCRLLGAPITPARQIGAASPDPQWLAQLEAEARLRDAPYARRRDIERALFDASPEWSGKIRSCPKCQTSFKSNSNMGQCTNCSFIFFGSHPELGDARDWMTRV